MRLVALILLLTAASAAAQSDPDAPSPGSAAAIAEQYVVALDSLDALLDTADRRLSSAVLASDAESSTNSGVARALGETSVAWRTSRAAECGLAGAMTGAGGSWPSAWALICEVEQTEGRLDAVREAAACVEAMPEDERVYDNGRCLLGVAAFGSPEGSAP